MNQPPSLTPDQPTPPRDDVSAVRQTLRTLRAKGWVVTKLEYSDGEFYDGSLLGRRHYMNELLAEVMAVEDIFVHVQRGDESGWLYFVFGNDPEEVVCNSTTNVDDDLEDLYRKWVG